MFKKNFIKLCNEKGVAPTVVCNEIGLSSATFSCWTDESVPRKTTLYKLADYFGVSVDYLLGNEDAKKEEPPQRLDQVASTKIHMVPVFATVSAGFGALARDEIVDYMPLCFEHPSEATQTICIRVRGDSMSPTIEDGDTIQVRKQNSVDSGSIAVVLIDGDEGLVKRVEYGENWIELHSINPSYKVIRRNGIDAENVRIVGLVTQIIKNVRHRKIGYVPTVEEYNETQSMLFRDIKGLNSDQLDMLSEYVDFLKSKHKK